jgi:hypothetical protein
MQKDFLVESRSYDHMLRGSWQAYKLSEQTQLGDEQQAESVGDALRLWLPAGTPMRWASGTRPLRYNCVQFFWPERWYMLAAFYNGSMLIHTYASVMRPATIEYDRLNYTDLELTILVKPDLSYEVLTQAEFDEAAEMQSYDEETRIGALMALRTLTSSIQISLGLFTVVPHQLKQEDFHLARCGHSS